MEQELGHLKTLRNKILRQNTLRPKTSKKKQKLTIRLSTHQDQDPERCGRHIGKVLGGHRCSETGTMEAGRQMVVGGVREVSPFKVDGTGLVTVNGRG